MKRHLSLDDRYEIENSLSKNLSFKEIARNIDKNCTTISREIRNHYIVKNTGGIGRQFNNCVYRTTCPNRGKNCNIKNCSEFLEEKCFHQLSNCSSGNCIKETNCSIGIEYLFPSISILFLSILSNCFNFF